MLTVIREMAEEAERREPRAPAARSPAGRCRARGGGRRTDAGAARRPAEAGVVDAGGAGLLEIMRGLAAGAAGEALPDGGRVARPAGSMRSIWSRPGTGYCTSLRRRGDGPRREALERELEQLGDSLLVVGDASALKVHVHTDDPGAALALGTRRRHGRRRRDREHARGRAASARAEPARARRSSPHLRRCRRGRRRNGNRRLFESFGRARHRGRPVDEPVDRGHRRGDRVRLGPRR